MNLLENLRVKFRALFFKETLDARMDDEMRSHIEMQTQENIDGGIPPQEARYAAVKQFRWIESINGTCRDQRGVRSLEDTMSSFVTSGLLIGLGLELLACEIPARWPTKVHPIIALRNDRCRSQSKPKRKI